MKQNPRFNRVQRSASLRAATMLTLWSFVATSCGSKTSTTASTAGGSGTPVGQALVQTGDLPKPRRHRWSRTVAHAQLRFQVLQRTFQRELKRRRRLDKVQRVQPSTFREMQPFLPRFEVIEKLMGRDFHGYSPREFG